MAKKLNYVAPEVEVLVINLEGCIAVSQTNFSVDNPFSNQEEKEW